MKDKTRILVVDDDPDLLSLTSTVLSRGGYEVMQASTGKDALEIVAQARPGLVLLDVVLPDMGGLEICKQIKADPDLRSTLVVLLSGVSTSSDAQAMGLDLGADGYMVKPIPNKELLARVHSLVRIREAEEVLRASEERHRSYIEVTGQLAWATNADGQVVEDLPALLRFTGQTKEEGKGIGWAGALHPDDVEQTLQMWKKAVATKSAYEVEYRLRRNDGVYRHFLARGVPVFDRDGSIREWVGTCIDITERKQVEEALRHAHDKLEQRVAERTAELSRANEELKQEVERHKQTEEALRNVLSELKALKDRLEAENIYFRQEITMKHQFHHTIGQSNAFKYVLYRAQQVAPTATTVLVLGETGTGKELIAAAIHQMSPRKERVMVTVNCAALPPNLIESELFGREKGAFTGADARRVGRFEIANGSTICLDEIGELPLEAQGKLLRVIQYGEFQRLGSPHTVKVDVRIVATTNRNLEEEVRKGRFRKDLYYRLNVFPITLPPLRQRKEDVPLLVQAFLERFSRQLGKEITSVPKETMQALREYEWPGNIRELENVIERAMILCQGPVFQLADRLADLPCSSSPESKTLEGAERDHILKALSKTSWRINGKNGAAAILGLNPSTLRARMEKLGIRRPEIKTPE
jgi:PAS domain S-box-containing protein